MTELTNRDERSAKFAQAKETYRKTGELPPGKLDVIYFGTIPSLRQVWQDMKEIFQEWRDSRNGAADGIEWGGERREAETMADPVDQSEQTAESEQPAQRKTGKRRLPPGKLDVIYTSGFPPFWKIWKSKGLMTIPPPRSSRQR